VNETIQKPQYKQHKIQQIQVHILPKHPHIHTHTITKQVKTNTVQDTHQMK